MPAPRYMAERRYSYHVAPRTIQPASTAYEVASPETDFERDVRDLFLTGQAHLHHEEYGLALAAFEELQLLILNTAHPEMPLGPGIFTDLPRDVALVDVLAEHAGAMLQATEPVSHSFPPSLIAETSKLPPDIQRKLEPATTTGLVVTSFHDKVSKAVALAADNALAERWDAALRHYESALKSAPRDDSLIRGVLLHDMALLADKADDHDRAVALGTDSLELLERSGRVDAQVRALEAMTGVYARAGEDGLATQSAEQAGRLRATHNLDPIVVASAGMPTASVGSRVVTAPTPRAPRKVRRLEPAPAGADDGGAHTNGAAEITAPPIGSGAVLLASQYVAAADAVKSYVVQGDSERLVLRLADGNGTQGLLDLIAVTDDLAVVTDFAITPTQMVAYLPHMYFFVIPMAIGDCLTGLGNLEEAEQTYIGTLPYPYINRRYEAVKLWTKLADVYLALGDAAYRAARDKVAAFAAARSHYENVVMSDGTLDAGSALYADATFSGVKGRIEAVLGAPDPASAGENPDLVTRVLAAKLKLDQIAAGLNFFGLARSYLPPFGWEYLQTTARYFAQSASQIEQRYILFKSTAENEELRQEQLAQQADVAAEAVVLEERGVAEAEAGVVVAEASLEYADEQHEAAVEAEDDFDDVRDDLASLDELDLLVQMGMDKNPENLANWLALVANQSERSEISHDLEEERLERAVDLASAARDVAREQLAQAQARKEVADQRLAIAQLQQTQAEENRDYLDAREFSARLWFDLAAQSKAITRRYLDMAIEIALLTERAYNAETERGLKLIRYDYSDAGVGDLLGADRLLADIDSFTADYVTTVKSKKLPVKQVISLGDSYPMALQQLRARGLCRFATEFAHFDRQHPGLHLCKLRNVELALVGITGATTVAGSLRNVGISKFRLADGSVVARGYPADVMPLSQYTVRNDALLFRFNPNDLKAFELSGIEALWQLELPPGANTFDVSALYDVQLVLYYDGSFSPAVEASVKAALPTSGAAIRTLSLALEFPDELFYLKSKGDAEIPFTAAMFPANQTNRVRTAALIRLTGKPATIGGLTLRLESGGHGQALSLTTSASGELDAAALAPLLGEPLLDRWTIRITAEDNPQLVRNGNLELDGLADLRTFLEYTFDYR